MQKEYDDTNTGALWRTESATPENKQPPHTGVLNVEGKNFQIAGWLKQAENGKKARLGLKIQEPKPKEVNAANNSNTSTTDDIPF